MGSEAASAAAHTGQEHLGLTPLVPGSSHSSGSPCALVRDIRVLLDLHGCHLVVDHADERDGAILAGPGIRIHLDAELAVAVAGVYEFPPLDERG